MNTNFHKHILNLFFGALALIALSACGGGGGGGGGATTCAPNCDPGPVDPATSYQPLRTEEAPSGGWVAALDAVRTAEYHATRTPTSGADPVEYSAADRIGAAYAYARGYTGAGIIVSSVGQEINGNHKDISGQWLQGYKISGSSSGATEGTCANAVECGADIQGTQIASIIAGKRGNGGIQGIAYNAKIKPITVKTVGNPLIGSASRASAIAEASGVVDEVACTASSVKTIDACKTITVMNNSWESAAFDDFSSSYAEGGTTYIYFTPVRFSAEGDAYLDSLGLQDAELRDGEKGAWETASETTVLVFAQGDYGQNSVNGMVKLYTGFFRNTYADKDVAWATVEKVGDADAVVRNLGGIHANLPTLASGIQNKILTVIALKEDNETIYEYSNGCGDAETYCLGAPGTAINSAIPGQVILLTGKMVAQIWRRRMLRAQSRF